MKFQSKSESRGNVLVVDDTPANLHLLTDILASRGYTVRPVPSGRLAISGAQAIPPDIILLDIMMPKMSGYDVCEQLKADERTRNIPIIFISALHEVFDKVKAFSLGGVDYITKPFQPEEVLARVTLHITLRKLQQQLETQNVQLREEIAERRHFEENLRQSEEKFRLLAENANDVIWTLSTDERFSYLSPSVMRLCGFSPEKLLHQSLTMLLPPESYQTAHQAIVAILQDHAEVEGPHTHILEYYRADGTTVWTETVFAPLCNSERRLIGILGVARDISERKRAEEAMRQRNRELALFNKLSRALQRCHTEEDTYPVLINAAKQLFPEDSGVLSLLDESSERLRTVASWGEPPVSDQDVDATCCQVFQHRQVHTSDNAVLPSHCPHFKIFPEYGYVCVPIRASDDILGVLSLCAGKSERFKSADADAPNLRFRSLLANRLIGYYALALANLRLRETLRRESIVDPLTNLYNRRYMEISLERETRRASRRNAPVGIIMVDIDHFKQFNDEHGHEAGDLVLRELGALLLRNIRGEDIVCRYGGEEFLLILPETSLKVVQQRAEDLRHAVLKLQVIYHKKPLSLTISLGVAEFPEHGDTAREVVKAADSALYEAKGRGRNCVAVALQAHEV